ncbi:hypothetical protein [Brevibacillus brevis]|uniref:hypothetical protein n=1 Tax=Brevibacillus brevis TaxID=1393 RepID=UPI00115845E6|nr:hypothetical protein [Lysinibacillus sp. SDF0063]TQR29415.1 hypothetical protein C7Y45_28875 [Lysinibacillus sp. SDF0063]
MTEIVVKLEESQRFVMEDPDSLAVIMVDQITILPTASQIVCNGYYFDIDYERMNFANRRKIQMVLDTKLRDVFNEED